LENIHIVKRNPCAIRDNLIIDDIDVAIEEVIKFRDAGGDSIVDVTNLGLGRDVKALYSISRATGVNLIAGASYYYHDTHPDNMDDKTVDEIKEEIINDIKYGVGETGIRAGYIGEVAISPELHPNEEKVIIASAKAQRETGAGFGIHIFPWADKGWPLGVDMLDIALKNGAEPGKVAINHVDVAMGIDPNYIRTIIKKGALVEFDNFGHEGYVNRDERQFIPGPFQCDFQRVETIRMLIDEGYIDQIVLGCDVCSKCFLQKFGGWGYAHLINNIVPMMYDYDISKEQINKMLVDNPAKLLDI